MTTLTKTDNGGGFLISEGFAKAICEHLDAPHVTPADMTAAINAAIPAPVTIPVASNAAPLPDNDIDGDINNASAGVSPDFSRADHSHPIIKQANPGDPVLTFIPATNAGALAAQVILDRDSTEESYRWKFRCLVQQVAGTGWDRIVVPPIAGFDQPIITGIGTYRNQSTSPQGDDGVQGAAPRGPYMGKEAHEWTSTRQIYMGFFRRDIAFQTFLEFWVEYVRLP